MRFYRLHVRRIGGESDGFLWFTSHKDAWVDKCQIEGQATEFGEGCGEVEPVDIEPTRVGILYALREYASHSDNG